MGKVRILLILAALAVAWPVEAQITPTYTFISGTLINPDEVNANFALLNNALNRTGGTMTGTLTARVIVPDGDNTRNFGSVGASWASAWFDGTVTVANVELTGVATFPQNGLKVADSNGSHYLILRTSSDLTADRNLTFVPGDAARIVTISGDTTISQDYSTTGTPQFAKVGVNAAISTGALVNVGGSFTGVGAAFGISVNPTLTVGENELGAAYNSSATIVEAAAGAHALLAGVRILAPTITVGAATVTNTASLYVAGSPTATVTGVNYAAWFDSGIVASDDGYRERTRAFTMGETQTRTFSAGNFTIDTGVLTVAAGDVEVDSYRVVGDTLYWSVQLTDIEAASTPGTQVRITLPNSYVLAEDVGAMGYTGTGSADRGVLIVTGVSGGTYLRLEFGNTANWPTSSIIDLAFNIHVKVS